MYPSLLHHFRKVDLFLLVLLFVLSPHLTLFLASLPSHYPALLPLLRPPSLPVLFCFFLTLIILPLLFLLLPHSTLLSLLIAPRSMNQGNYSWPANTPPWKSLDGAPEPPAAGPPDEGAGECRVCGLARMKRLLRQLKSSEMRLTDVESNGYFCCVMKLSVLSIICKSFLNES